MDWSKSYSASWRVYKVNRKTWADAEILKRVDSLSVTKTADGNLLESGSLETTGDFTSDYYRIVMIATQGSITERVDVATLLFESTGGEINYGRTAYNVDGYSVLYPASTTAVTTGEYAPSGVDGVEYAAKLLRESINAPIEIEGGFILNDHLVHELGSSVLDAVWAVLDAGNHVMQIDGRGVVHIRPKPQNPVLVIDNAKKRLLMNKVDFESNISEIPNRYIVIADDIIAIATNDDPDSIVSTRSRGYNVDVVDTSPTPVNGKTYGEYANDRLKEMSVLKDTRVYTREYAPNVYPYSIVRASIDSIMGDLRVESQNIECGNGIKFNEKATREIQLW